MWRVCLSLRHPRGCPHSCALAFLEGSQPIGSSLREPPLNLWALHFWIVPSTCGLDASSFSRLPTDPAAKLPYINKPLLFLTVRDVGLALVEEENRPGKKEVMSRSKCQKERLLGLKFPDLGCVWGGCCRGMVHGGVWVCMLCMQPPICFKWNPIMRFIK